MEQDGLKPRGMAIENIEDYIVKNGLNPGDRLPSERAMCDMWHLNRVTLRSGIAQLVDEGVVEQKSGSGTFVATPKLLRNLQDSRGFYRTAVDAGRHVETILLKFEMTEADKRIGQKMKKSLGHKLWHMDRLRKMDGIPVALSIVYLDAQLLPGLTREQLEQDSLYDILERDYQVVPFSGEQVLSIAFCTEEEAQLLHVKEKDAVILQTGITQDEENCIFEYYKEMTLSKYISFSSRLIRR